MDDQNRLRSCLFEHRFHSPCEFLDTGCSSLAPVLVPHVADNDRCVISGDALLKCGYRPIARSLEWMYPGAQFEVHLRHARRSR